MKTVQQIAEELGVTVQAVYKKLKVNRVVLSELNPIKQGNKTFYDDGVCEMIKQLFNDNSTVNQDNLKSLDRLTDVKVENERLKKEVERLKTERDAAMQEAETQKMRADMLENIGRAMQAQNAHFMEQNKTLADALKMAQEVQAAQTKTFAPVQRLRLTERIKSVFRSGKGVEHAEGQEVQK